MNFDPSVKLRPIDVSDTDAILRWRSEPEVLRQLFSEQAPSREEHLRWLDDLQIRDDRHEFIIEVAGERAIGTIGLSRIDRLHRRAEYGILIGEAEARGRGYGQAASVLILQHAFDKLGLHRVYLHTFADNLTAIRLYRQLGFQLEGTLRDHIFRAGSFRDVVVMGLLKEEWNQQ